MAGIGIDIGSTATKAVVADPSGAIAFKLVIPTGFSSVEVAEQVRRAFSCEGFEMDEMPVVATGMAVSPFHTRTRWSPRSPATLAARRRSSAKTAPSSTSGQDTKAIGLAGGKVRKFVMNDKCSAGTGRFLEIMVDRLGVSQAELARLAAAGQPTVISSMCTVFAESEVISLVGKGEPRENIARGIIDSVVARVCTLVGQVPAARYHLTGGLCENDYVRARLEAELGAPVGSCPDASFAGALGAAIIAAEMAGEA